MRYLLRNKDTGIVHDALWDGRDYMVTTCGLHIHKGTGRWMRSKYRELPVTDENNGVSCKKCRRR